MRRVVKSCKRGSSVYSAPCEVGRLPKSGSGNLLNKVTGEHPGGACGVQGPHRGGMMTSEGSGLRLVP